MAKLSVAALLVILCAFKVQAQQQKARGIEPELAIAQRAVWEAWYSGDTARDRSVRPSEREVVEYRLAPGLREVAAFVD